MTARPKGCALVISIRRISLGGGFRYLMESVARGDGATERSSSLASYYAESGTPPGVFLGVGARRSRRRRRGRVRIAGDRGASAEHAGRVL